MAAPNNRESDRTARRQLLLPYSPPAWAQIAASIPRWRVDLLTARPTPLHTLQLAQSPLLVPHGFHLSLKRDDLTGVSLSGNKSRKLEFILADAIDHNADAVITCGAVQSNHARVTAAAARQLGLTPYAFLRSKTPNTDPEGSDAGGNLAIHKLLATHITLVPPEKYETGLKPRMERLAAALTAKDGTHAHLIPVGGSDKVGVWGYIDAWDELTRIDKISDRFDDLVLATGSGGTAAGLAIGNWMTGSTVRIHAISVCDSADCFYDHIDQMLAELGLDDKTKSRDILSVIDGYKGMGYGQATEAELDQLIALSSSTGVILDPVYTSKAFFGMLTEMELRPEQFAGRRCLFLHTGGIFGALGHAGFASKAPVVPLTKTRSTTEM